MPGRTRTSLSRVLDDLGETLLALVGGRVSGANDLGGIVIYDSEDDVPIASQAVVLGVGIHDDETIERLLYDLGRQGAAALVVRGPIQGTPALHRAIRRSGVVLLELTRGATWAQLAAMLRTLLFGAEMIDESRQTIGGMPAGDLFALANAISALLDAPVTIEDRQSVVLAFSGRQDEADASRIATIVGRQVPERFTEILHEAGVFTDLYRSRFPIFVDPAVVGTDVISTPRAALAVRAGDEILGSIWAAVGEPLDDERAKALVDAAKVVSLHLLRLRASADAERRVRADLVGTALEGGPSASDALGRLGLLGQPLAVLALDVLPARSEAPHGGSSLLGERHRLADALALHLSAVQPHAAVALIGEVAYALLPTAGDADAFADRASKVVSNFLDRTGDRISAVVGIGSVARDSADLARSRRDADRARRVLVIRGRASEVATVDQVKVDALMLDLRDGLMARGERVSGAIARLVEYDRNHDSQLTQTLRCWLAEFGDISKAAAASYVHVNTFRYRLKRLAEIANIDLADTDDRFEAQLYLRLLELPDMHPMPTFGEGEPDEQISS